MAVINCRHFNGYKPCGKNDQCSAECPHQELIQKNVLIIHLGALGSVVRSSALLRKLKKEEPHSFVVWLTSEAVLPLLQQHPAVDQLYDLNFINLLKLQAMTFDDIYVIDKSLEAVSVAMQLKAKRVHGYHSHPLTGALIPQAPAANELWEVGLSNHKKFYENRKTELQLIFESLGFSYQGELYWLNLSQEELALAGSRKERWQQQAQKKIILGINTGCSQMIPYKKLSLEKQGELISTIQRKWPSVQIVLLGGKEDAERNELLSKSYMGVINSDTQSGLRDGVISVQACDIVISGDSLGMHLAIALGKFTIAWFGPTCDHEIDMFGKGVKIKTYLSCSPCWKRSCSQVNMCYNHVHISDFISALSQGINKIENNKIGEPTTTEKDSYSAHSFFR